MYAMDSEYRILDDAIKSVMRRSAGDAVLLGYLLRRMMDEKLWTRQYDSLDGYLREELHMDYTMACRFEAINRKYSIGGHSKDIDEKWEGFSQGVLIEMLNMPSSTMRSSSDCISSGVLPAREPDMPARLLGPLQSKSENSSAAAMQSESRMAMAQRARWRFFPGRSDATCPPSGRAPYGML